MRALKVPLLGALLFLIAGCAQMFTAQTVVTYQSEDRVISYSSNKDQTGLVVDYEADPDGRVRKVHISADQSVTPEAAIAGAIQSQNKLIEGLIPLLKAAAPGP